MTSSLQLPTAVACGAGVDFGVRSVHSLLVAPVQLVYFQYHIYAEFDVAACVATACSVTKSQVCLILMRASLVNSMLTYCWGVPS